MKSDSSPAEPKVPEVTLVWLGEFGYGQWFTPTHIRVGAGDVTFCGTKMARPGHRWSGTYDQALTPNEQISCGRCLKKLHNEN